MSQQGRDPETGELEQRRIGVVPGGDDHGGEGIDGVGAEPGQPTPVGLRFG